MSVQRLRLARAIQSFQGRGPVGPRALLSAVIAVAALDVADGDPAAAAYFLSDLYRHHVTLAGLPPEYLPEGVTRADLAGMGGYVGLLWADYRAPFPQAAASTG